MRIISRAVALEQQKRSLAERGSGIGTVAYEFQQSLSSWKTSLIA